jgi:hypothetical protein
MAWVDDGWGCVASRALLLLLVVGFSMIGVRWAGAARAGDIY